MYIPIAHENYTENRKIANEHVTARILYTPAPCGVTSTANEQALTTSIAVSAISPAANAVRLGMVTFTQWLRFMLRGPFIERVG